MAWTLGNAVVNIADAMQPTSPIPASVGSTKWAVPDDVALALIQRGVERVGGQNIPRMAAPYQARYNLRGQCLWASLEAKAYLCSTLNENVGVVRIPRVVCDGRDDHYFVVVWAGSEAASTIVDLTWTQFCSAGNSGGLPYWLGGTLSNLKVTLKLKGVNLTNGLDDLVEAWQTGLKVGKKPGKAVA